MTATARVGINRIAKNASVLLLAQIGSRALAVIYIAALARYVGADGVGKISTATALIGLMVLMLWPGMDSLLIRDVAVDTDKASTYVSNMLVSRFFLGIFFLLLVPIVSLMMSYPLDTIYIIIVYALVYFIDSLGEILTSTFRAFQQMEYEAGTQVARDLVNFSLSLLAIYLHLPLIAIVFMSLVAQTCKLVLVLVLSVPRFVRPRLIVSPKTMKTLFTSSLPFGVLVVLYTIQNQLGTVVLSLGHPAATVGTFSAANTLISTLLLVPNALFVAIYPAFSRLYVSAPGGLSDYYSLAFKYLLILGLPLGLGTLLVADDVILLIYGHGFEGSIVVLQILAPFLFTIVAYCNGPLLYATGRERFLAKTLALAVCAYGLLCVLLIPPWGAVGAAIAFVATGLATASVYSIYCHRLLKLSLPWVIIGKVALASALMGLVTFIALRAGMNWLVAAILIAPGCYVGLLFSFGLVNREELRALVGQKL